MKRVLRYDVKINDLPPEIPDYRIVMFGRAPSHRGFMMEHTLGVWVEVPTPDDWPDSEQSYASRRVQVVGTGHPVPDGWHHLASVVDGPFAWHLYEVAP